MKQLLFLVFIIFESMCLMAQEKNTPMVIVYGQLRSATEHTPITNQEIRILNNREFYPLQECTTEVCTTDNYGCFIDTVYVTDTKGYLDLIVGAPYNTCITKAYRINPETNTDYIGGDIDIFSQSISNGVNTYVEAEMNMVDNWNVQYSIDSDLNDIVNVVWNFGDGHSSEEPNPTHTYSKPGLYQVCIYITANINGNHKLFVEKKYVFISSVKTNMLCGNVLLNYLPLGKAKIQLYKYNERDIPLPLDTIRINNPSGLYYFDKLVDGKYLLKVIPDSSDFPDVIPAYYINRITWNNANKLHLNSDTYGAEIYMYVPSYDTFDGSIMLGGSVTFLNPKGENEQELPSIEGIEILLLSGTTMEALGSVVTDQDGYYEFHNLRPGSYYILADYTGAETELYPCEIKADKRIAENEVDIELYYPGYTVDVEEIDTSIATTISLYPNPAKDHFSVELPEMEQEAINYVLYNTSGQIVKQKEGIICNGKQALNINVCDLKNACYILHIQGENSSFVHKVIVRK